VKTVQEIVEQLRQDLKESHRRKIQLDREDAEEIVNYFDDLDYFRNNLLK
jgi:hypothetical protein